MQAVVELEVLGSLKEELLVGVSLAHGFTLVASVDVVLELGDLVGVHDWSGHLDWSCPVEVEVAQVVGEQFQVLLAHAGLIQGHVEVSGQSTPLGGVLRN